MAIVLGVVAVAAIIVLLLWGLLKTPHETAMGRENRARREARKAAKRKGNDPPGEH